MSTAFAPSTSPAPLSRRQRLGIDQERLRRRLLDVHHRPDLAGDLRLDVVALVEHERDIGVRAESVRQDDLVHDPEQLERVGRADHQVVVGVEARVEVEPAEAIGAEQRGHDELDVGARRVMAGVDDDLRLRPGGDALEVGGSPVRHVHRVERRLEELVLEEHPLVRHRAARGRRRAPRRDGPGEPGCRPGPGSSCHPRTTA